MYSVHSDNVVKPPYVHKPKEVWRRFRTSKTEPTPERLTKARIAANKRYFRTCTRCQTLCHMLDLTTYQSCLRSFWEWCISARNALQEFLTHLTDQSSSTHESTLHSNSLPAAYGAWRESPDAYPR